ncbi:MAG: SpoVG family protein [Sedimentisphaerales bacterium]
MVKGSRLAGARLLGEARKMEISEVRVKLVENKDDRLKAFCSVTMDNEFVIRDIKIIEGTGGLFVAMPSRKMSDHCPKCGGKNHLRAKFCNNCAATLQENRAKKDMKGRMKLHADIAHPINAECRQKIQEKVIVAFKEEVEKSKQPDYKPVEMDEPDDEVPEKEAVEKSKQPDYKPVEMDEPDDEVPEIVT